MTKNRLHGVPRPIGESFIHRFNLIPPAGQLFSDENRTWWQAQDFSSIVRIQIEQDLLILEHLTAHKEAIHQELACLSNRQPWADDMVFLMQIPGLGVVLSMTVLAAIGEIARFEHPKKLVGYAGLGAGVHDSGQKHQGQGTLAPAQTAGAVQVLPKLVARNSAGPWSKRPPQKIGTLWGAVRSDPHWKSQYENLKKRGKHSNEAIVAIARKMLVAVWHVLTKREPHLHSSVEDLAYKMLTLVPLRDLVSTPGRRSPPRLDPPAVR